MAVYERELYVVFLGKVFFLPWKTEEFIKLVDLESTRILEFDEKVTSPKNIHQLYRKEVVSPTDRILKLIGQDLLLS